ncbi:MAG: DPP IV N-terminal domain-containing protein [Sphingobacteriia bacterium]
MLLPGILPAQSNRMQLPDIFNPQLYPRGLSQLGWRADTDAYSYQQGDSLLWYMATDKAVPGKPAGTLSLAQLNAARKGKAMPNLPVLSWLDAQRLQFSFQDTLWVYDLTTQALRFVNTVPAAEQPDLHPQTLAYAYVDGADLYIQEAGQARNLTQNQLEGVSYGRAAHRQEFGITKGTFWSPRGSLLAFYRMDERPVSDMPMIDITQTPALNKPFKYPMAGQATQLVTVGVYALKSGQTVYLQTPDPKDTYLTNISWDPEERYVYIAELNRDQNHLQLVQYDARSGQRLRVLLEEREAKYVEPEHGPIFFPNDPTRFLWFSERDGWQHLYLYTTEGKLLNQLTEGSYEVTEFLGFANGGETLVYTCTANRGMDRQLHYLPLKGRPQAESTNRQPQSITSKAGVHSGQLSPSGQFLLDTYSGPEMPLQQQLLSLQGRQLKSLKEAKNPLANFAPCEVSLLDVEAPDGTQLNAKILLPAGFDRNQRYPVLVYVYNGPHVQLVQNSWLAGFNYYLYFLAQQGYIVFTVDGRGSQYRGLNFEQATFRRLGQTEVDDQLAGVKFLKGLSYVDSSRIAVHGWSYGGYMTTRMLTRHPGVFACGIAGAPVIDWKYYEIMYTERYMDTPEANPKGYEAASNLVSATGLQDPLLLIHGTADDVVVWQHTLSFLQTCISAGATNVDYMVYPGHGHHVGGPDRRHLYQYMYRYLQQHCPANAR